MLNTLTTTLTETLNLLIKAFRLSSLFPAFCFSLIQGSMLLLYPFERNPIAVLKDSRTIVPSTIVLCVFLSTALLAYLLNFLNSPLIFLFEGYPYLGTFWGRAMKDWYKQHRDWLEAQTQRQDLPEVDRLLYHERLNDNFPPDAGRCAPTALGNVTAAFEAYPQRYGIDAIYLWPRLVPVLSKEKYAAFVEREKEGFDLFLNFTVLCTTLAIESIVLRLILHNAAFTWIAIVGACAACLCYSATVSTCRRWGETIKTAFDLYRYQLARQLDLLPFDDKTDEFHRWQSLSDFIKYGQYDDFGAYDYPLPSPNEKPTGTHQA